MSLEVFKQIILKLLKTFQKLFDKVSNLVHSMFILAYARHVIITLSQ